jgi:hypothetical protein
VLERKKKFSWSAAAAKAFKKIKEKMGQTPVLKLPDFSKFFEVVWMLRMWELLVF